MGTSVSDQDQTPQTLEALEPEDATKMEKHLEEVTRTLESMAGWGRDLEALFNEANGNLKDQIEELEGSFSNEVSRLSSLRRSLSRTIEAITQRETRLTNLEPVKSLEPIFHSIPELKFVSWKNANSLETPSMEHFAIEIPVSQPSADDLNPSQDHSRRGVSRRPQKQAPVLEKRKAPETSEKSKQFRRIFPGDSQQLEELPDRIRICSQRLGIFLDFNIHDASLNRSTYSRTPFTILRPFKFLVFKDEPIRRALTEFEHVRYERHPRSEEEYDDEWRTNLPEDSIEPTVIDPHSIQLSELTALIKDLRCLIKFMDGYIKPTLEIGRLVNIFFSDLWYVFPAGSLIYLKDKMVPQKIWKVIQRTGGRRYTSRPRDTSSDRGEWHLRFSPFVLDCFHLDYDGNRYVQTYTAIQIDHFEGCQPITSLSVLPIQVAEDAELFDKQELVERGKEFVNCTRPSHSHSQYTGRNQTLRPNGAKAHEKDADMPENATRYAEWIESEVMVDFERALQEMPGWRPGVNDLTLHTSSFGETSNYDGLDNDSVWDGKQSKLTLEKEIEKCQKWDKERTQPTEVEDLLLLPERVFAFVFRTRKWACLKLGKGNDGERMLKERRSRQDPWNDLQLPDGHKRLVQSLIESHSPDKGPNTLHFDLVRAKGKGVIILLHGVPGVGKTSTAECAAEANKRPLLPITCGDLGTAPRDVEKKLEEAFQLAQLWNCVLLLDEADIFLAQRSENDIQRNALVSVFLRVLEYYEGILFLTTNRVGVFDEAFKSRIHMALYYPTLKWKYTEKIWRTHLKKLVSSGLVDIDEEDIISYAETFFEKQDAKGSPVGPVWNGRQIRNAFQSAVALAGHRSEGGKIRVEREHFERVSKVSNEFNHYIWSIKSQTDADKASQWGYRYDQYRIDETIHMKALQSNAGPGIAHPSVGQTSQTNTSPPPINNPFQGFPQQNFPQRTVQHQDQQPPMIQNNMGPSPNLGQSQFTQGLQGLQGQVGQQTQSTQGQVGQQPQQPYQQGNFASPMNALGNQVAQPNVSLQGQSGLNGGLQGGMGQYPAGGGGQM